MLLAHLCLSSFAASLRQNIPGLDAPSWSRTGGVDETQEAEEEEAAARQWKKDQQTGSQKVKVGGQRQENGVSG